MAFGLKLYPVIYRAKYENNNWKGEYLEKFHKTAEEEETLDIAEQEKLANERNFFQDMPLINYTTQYGLGCFEGLKALPQKDGGLSIFRPEKNGERFHKSMKGLYMPPFPEEEFVNACTEVVKRNAELGFRPFYKNEWEKDSFINADSVYIRPFTLSEGGIGVNISQKPWVIIAATPVSSYFSGSNFDAVTTKRIRATPFGTGWIKAASNYTIASLAKYEAIKEGYMECIFLDAENHTFVEEGSSCNIFFFLKSGELVTPELGDTILPGITRASIIELAKDKNLKVTERKISIIEAQEETAECFVTGTAAGATPITSITHLGKKCVFNQGKTGDLTTELRDLIKGIQYGSVLDSKKWLTKVL